MPREAKPAKAPGALGDFLGDITTPPPKATPAAVIPEAQSSARQPSRVSKHHVSLYVDPAVDRAFKRLALDQKLKTWEVYHEALRQYLDDHGYSFDDLMAGGKV